MKFSEQTIEILRNFSTIHTNIVFRPGNVVKTMAEAKNIMAIAKIAEDLPREFGIYDLSEFLGALDLIEDADLELEEKSLVIHGGNSSLRYVYGAIASLTTPTKDVKMPTPDLTIDLSHKVLTQVKKAASFLGHPTMSIVASEGKVCIAVSDTKNPSTNSYSVQLDDVAEGKTGTFVFPIANLKIMADDYQVDLSSKYISHFRAKNLPVEYFIAMEKPAPSDREVLEASRTK